MNKVLIALAIIIVLAGLIGCLVWWWSKSRNKTYEHKRTIPYPPPNQELVHKKIDEELKALDQKKDSSIIPKVVYMTYHDIDGIPPDVLENFKKYCKGYRIEIHGDQSCEDFLYNYYGPDAMQIFKEINVGAHKADLWRYCILYAKGGYYFDIKTNFKRHIDDIFKVRRQREWFTVFCDRNYPSCIYNGIIVTHPKNPILWDAMRHFYTNINTEYLTHVHYLFRLLNEECQNTLRIGSNTQKNGWECTLFTENCVPCGIDQKCSKHKGANCTILSHGKEVANVEPYFPWPKSDTISPPTSLLIIDGEKSQKVSAKPCVAILGSFNYHYECVGFLLDILSENYEIHVYHNDTLGFLDLFSLTYEFKSFYLGLSNADAKDYIRCIILTSDDPVTLKNTKLTTRIVHLGSLNDLECSESLKLSPLVRKDAKYILPVYRTAFPFSYERQNRIVFVGYPTKWSYDILSFLAQNTMIPIIHFDRGHEDNEEMARTINNISPHIKTIVNLKAIAIEKEIGQAKFLLVNKVRDRFSGAIALALSGKTPMIIDSSQASAYDFPALVYTDMYDLVSKLEGMDSHGYNNLHKQVVDFTDSLLKKNRTICPAFAFGSFTLVEVRNREGRLDWGGKISQSVFQSHEHRWVPKGMAAAMETIREASPDASYTFYDKDNCREYIEKHYPSALEPYDSLVPGAYRCDLFRYIRLYNEGGVYLDSPYSIPLGLLIFGDIIRLDDEFIASWDEPIIKSGGGEYCSAQGFLASTPKHPIIHKAIEDALSLIKSRSYNDSPLSITGPVMFGRVIEKLAGHKMEGTRMLNHIGGKILDGQGIVIHTRYPDYEKDRYILQSGFPHYDYLWEKGKVYRDSPNKSSGEKDLSQIIHRTFRTLPETMELFSKAWNDTATNLPDWKQIFYSNSDVEEWISLHFPLSSAVPKAYHAINPVYGAARADFFRYLVAYVHGGLYIDIKSAALKNPPQIPPGTDLLVSPWLDPSCTEQLGPEGEMQNWYIYARPGSKVLIQVIEHVISNIASVQDDPNASCLTLVRNGNNNEKDAVLGTTGPVAYTIALRKYEETRREDDKKVDKVGPNLNDTLTYSANGGHEESDPKHYTKQKGPLILPNSPKITPKDLERLKIDLQRA